MSRVTPRMYPDDEMVYSYLEAVAVAVERGAAKATDAWGGYGHWKATMDTLVVTPGDERLVSALGSPFECCRLCEAVEQMTSSCVILHLVILQHECAAVEQMRLQDDAR